MRLAHRDYKAANIHVRPGASLEAPDQADRLALIDLQGAFMAPPEYDLVCLLRDSHVPLDAAEVDAQLEHAVEQLPEPPDADTARLRFDALTISRVGKDLAHYLDAARHRDDDRYLGFVAIGLSRLRIAAARLRARDASWCDLADLVESLSLPARCAALAEEARPCVR
jgi:aminoglycoside/choline kinase family phosphotransferase